MTSVLQDKASAPRLVSGLNMLLLIGGFAVGQGSLFGAQTWLVAHGELTLLSNFGSHFNFAMLGLFIVEAGSLATLSRAAANLAADKQAIVDQYWATTLVRLGLALFVAMLCLVWVMMFADAFSFAYILSAAPALLIRAVNVTGLLDGMRRSGIGGLSSAFVYVASACAVFFAARDPWQSGMILGAAFTFGTLLTAIVQQVAVRRIGFALPFSWPSKSLVWTVFKDSIAMLANEAPGQVFYRVQIAMAALILGAHATGLFVYAKQIVNAISLLVVFIRRIEFPVLVDRLSRDNSEPVQTTFWTLRLGLFLSAAASILVLLSVVTGRSWLPPEFADTAQTMLYFVPVIISGAIFSTVSQGLFAMGRYGSATKSINVAIAMGLTMSYLLPLSFGVAGLAAAECLMHVVGTVLQIFVYRRTIQYSREY